MVAEGQVEAHTRMALDGCEWDRPNVGVALLG